MAYAAAARTAGTWASERDAAEATRATARPWEWISVRLTAGRGAEAWAFALEHPDAATNQCDQLCDRRAGNHPADVIPYYQRMVNQALTTTGRGSYLTAARLLVRLRAACTADTPTTFTTFITAPVEAYRRRPTASMPSCAPASSEPTVRSSRPDQPLPAPVPEESPDPGPADGGLPVAPSIDMSAARLPSIEL